MGRINKFICQKGYPDEAQQVRTFLPKLNGRYAVRQKFTRRSHMSEYQFNGKSRLLNFFEVSRPNLLFHDVCTIFVRPSLHARRVSHVSAWTIDSIPQAKLSINSFLVNRIIRLKSFLIPKCVDMLRICFLYEYIYKNDSRDISLQFPIQGQQLSLTAHNNSDNNNTPSLQYQLTALRLSSRFAHSTAIFLAPCLFFPLKPDLAAQAGYIYRQLSIPNARFEFLHTHRAEQKCLACTYYLYMYT